MVLEDLVCFFDGNEEIKPRIRLAGAGVRAASFFLSYWKENNLQVPG